MHWVMHISILTAGPFGPAYEARQTGSSISQGRKAEAFPAHRAEAAAAGGATPMLAGLRRLQHNGITFIHGDFQQVNNFFGGSKNFSLAAAP